MPSFSIVEIDISLEALEQLQTIIGWLQVHMLIFQASPEALDVNVIQRPSFSIHRYLDSIVLQHALKLSRSELASLIGIQYFWFAVKGYRLFQYIGAPGRVHRIRNTPI